MIYIKSRTIDIKDKKEFLEVTKALSNELRLSIVTALSENSYTVNELATKLNIPVSTAALNIQILEDAGIVLAEYSPGKRGSKKLCSRKVDSLLLELEKKSDLLKTDSVLIDIPVGSFNDANVVPTCGMASEYNFIIPEDIPEFFHTPNKHKAQIIWFSEGFVKYKFKRVLLINV